VQRSWVSIICFQRDQATGHLNGRPVPQINADHYTDPDLTRSQFSRKTVPSPSWGDSFGEGAFDAPGELARN